MAVGAYLVREILLVRRVVLKDRKRLLKLNRTRPSALPSPGGCVIVTPSPL